MAPTDGVSRGNKKSKISCPELEWTGQLGERSKGSWKEVPGARTVPGYMWTRERPDPLTGDDMPNQGSQGGAGTRAGRVTRSVQSFLCGVKNWNKVQKHEDLSKAPYEAGR